MTDKNFEEEEVDENDGKLVYEQKFKGKAILVLKKTESDQFPFSFGLGKARLILDNYQAIEAFVAKHGKERD